MEPLTLYLAIAVTATIAVAILTVATLKGFTAWLAYKRVELAARSGGGGTIPSRIELADMRERIRKLEAIAAGVDL